MLGSFSFHWRSVAPEHVPVERIVLAGLPDADDRSVELQRAIALGGAGWRSRMLATVPSNLKNPSWLADQAREVAGECTLDITVWDEKQLAAEGFGGIVAVGQASATPPRLIRLDYAPENANRKTPTVVLVGKGITFDTGGLSIKPGEAMVNMKRDMTGGAVVIAVMGALRSLGCPVRVVGLVAAAENAVGGNALRPGDVVRHYGGRTSEVTNTDAEGRLVLADAIAYAVDKIDPAVGRRRRHAHRGHEGGAGAAGRRLLRQPTRASPPRSPRPPRRPGSRCGASRSRTSTRTSCTPTVADADNAPSGPGAITAALFLQHFAGDVPWAHLDVASVGDSPKERPRVDHRADRLRRPRVAGVARQRRPPGGAGMKGLTVRWSLTDAPDGVEQELASYVEGTSHAKFTGMAGLRFKTWRMRAGEWFEGCYVFATDEARAEFQATFTAGAADAPGSKIIGSAPVLIEACDVVAVAEGWDGFRAAARY